MRQLTISGQLVTMDDDIAAIVESGLRLQVMGNHSLRQPPRVLIHLQRIENLVIQPGKGFVVDHINQNTLDVRRENLQAISAAQNIMKKHTTDRPGVSLRKGGRFRVSLGRGRSKEFPTLIQAQLAADAYRRSLGIKGMPLNFPEVGEHYHDGRLRTE